MLIQNLDSKLLVYLAPLVIVSSSSVYFKLKLGNI